MASPDCLRIWFRVHMTESTGAVSPFILTAMLGSLKPFMVSVPRVSFSQPMLSSTQWGIRGERLLLRIQSSPVEKP